MVISYLFCIKSIINVDGFPTTIGSCWVELHTAATMEPEPKIDATKKLLGKKIGSYEEARRKLLETFLLSLL